LFFENINTNNLFFVSNFGFLFDIRIIIKKIKIMINKTIFNYCIDIFFNFNDKYLSIKTLNQEKDFVKILRLT
jgi:hypothetical protein